MLWLKHIFKKVFLEDWVMKVVALLITLALWLGVTGLSTPTTQRLTSVPISLTLSNNNEITNAAIQEVTLVVTGDSRRLGQINKNDLVASIDISGVMPGDRVIPLTPETVSVSLPTGVKLDEIQPRNMAVRIEPVEEKEVDVEAETYGQPPNGYEVYQEITTPAKVRVRGPAGFMRSLQSVSTERIDISDRTSDVTMRQVPISVSDPKASLLSETTVDVVIRIGESRVERVYSVAVGDGSGRRALVTLFGPRSLFENLQPADLSVDVRENRDGDDVPTAVLPPALDGRVDVRSVRLR
jgi:YbbR domain-containing protein